MLQPRLLRSRALPFATVISKILSRHTSPIAALAYVSFTPSRVQTRSASHATQGRANKAAPGPGKRLGAKKGQSEPVVPGNIIFRQRGSLWFPGENCVMGRDHTISALAKGFVQYYRDPFRNPKRKYIGVVYDLHDRLPYPPNAARRRRLGMEEVRMEYHNEKDDTSGTDEAGPLPTSNPKPKRLRTSFEDRLTNTQIGRTRAIRVPRDKKSKFFGDRARARGVGRKHVRQRKREARIAAGLPAVAARKKK